MNVVNLTVPRFKWINHLPVYVERVQMTAGEPIGWYVRIGTHGWVWTRGERKRSRCPRSA